MEQEPITQRVKFLAESLGDSVRAFGLAIGEKQTNTSNYITGRNKPSADFLEKIVTHFRNVSAHWLLTGEGEPFLPSVAEPSPVYQKKNKGQTAGINHGTMTNQAGPNLQLELDHAHQTISQLQKQIELQERLLRVYEATSQNPT